MAPLQKRLYQFFLDSLPVSLRGGEERLGSPVIPRQSQGWGGAPGLTSHPPSVSLRAEANDLRLLTETFPFPSPYLTACILANHLRIAASQLLPLTRVQQVCRSLADSRGGQGNCCPPTGDCPPPFRCVAPWRGHAEGQASQTYSRCRQSLRSRNCACIQTW